MTLNKLEDLLIGCKELYFYYDLAFNCGEAIDLEDIEDMANTLTKIEPNTKKREYKRLLKKIFNI